VDFASRHRLPSVFGMKDFALAGGLLSYGPDIAETLRGSTAYIDRILKGAKASDLPVEQPSRLELVVNLKTARALGLTIPESVRLRADQTIE
jgi:putative ABC transport system substrate-binding protein